MKSNVLADPGRSLPGRSEKMPVPPAHFVSGRSMEPPFPAGLEVFYVGMGCFWGAERFCWQIPGVYVTAVGYAGGFTPNPTYEEVCSGMTGHAEVVAVIYDPVAMGFDKLLKQFFEAHNPTQGMRQGNDIGTQYRSVVYTTTPEQLRLALVIRNTYEEALKQRGLGEVTTEIAAAPEFYFAEPYHQQYLAKNPDGYCGLKGTGVTCPL